MTELRGQKSYLVQRHILYRPNKEVSPGACWLIHKKQVTFLCLRRDLFFIFSSVFEEICFFVQGSLRASSLFGAVARSHTKAARETDDASTWGGWLASLALNGVLASRLYDQGIHQFSKLKDDERMKDGKFCWLLILVCMTLVKYEPSNYMAPLSMSSP